MSKKIRQIITHPLFSGSMIMVVGSNAVSFLSYLYHFVMGRLLGPGNYGELAAIISLIGLLGIIPGSINLVITKQIASVKSDLEVDYLVSWFKTKILLISIIYTLILLALSPIMTAFLKIESIYYLIIIAVSFLFSLQASLNRSVLQGLLKFKEIVISVLVENSAKLALSIALVYTGFQVGGAMVALTISSVLGLYTTIIYLKTKYYPESESISPNIKSMVTFAIPVSLQFIAITSLYSSDIILVKHFFSSSEAGMYAALSTLGKIIFFGASPIVTVMFPLVSNRIARGQSHKDVFIYSFLVTILFIAGLVFLYWLIPELAIRLLYGTAYLEAANLLVWFSIFMGLFTLSSLLTNYGLSLGRSSIVILPLIASIAQIVLIVFFHQSLLEVIIISIIVSALLLISLLIYSRYGKPFFK